MADLNVLPGQEIDTNVTGVVDLQNLLQRLTTKYNDLRKVPAAVWNTDAHQDQRDKVLDLIEKVKKRITAANSPEHPEFTQDTKLHKNKLDAFLEKIAVECSDYVATMKETKTVLRRGTRSSALIFKGHPRPDRRPTTSDPEMQAALDKELEENGFEARRGNSLFVTTDSKFAADYGSTYLIFPVNGFKFTWMPNTKELILGQGDGIDIPEIWDFSDEDFDAAMDSGHEIYLKGDFYALRARSLFNKVQQFFDVQLKK